MVAAGGAQPKLEIRDLAISYGGTTVLSGVDLEIYENEIFGIIGPANSGKTSFLRALNRMDLFTPGMRVDGAVVLDGRDVRKWRNVYALRRRVGVLFFSPRRPVERGELQSFPEVDKRAPSADDAPVESAVAT